MIQKRDELPGVLNVTEDGVSCLFGGSVLMTGFSKHLHDKTRGSVILWLSREQLGERFKEEHSPVDTDASGDFRTGLSASPAASVSTRSLR